jgi:hypothetical protein
MIRAFGMASGRKVFSHRTPVDESVQAFMASPFNPCTAIMLGQVSSEALQHRIKDCTLNLNMTAFRSVQGKQS